MSIPSQSADAPGKEPSRKRRRRRPRGPRNRNSRANAESKQDTEHESSSNVVAQEGHSPSAQQRSGFKKNGVTNGEPHQQGRSGKEQGAGENRKKVPYYAALDLGTNNCRLLIATPQRRGRFRVVDGFSRIVRLGEGMSQTGRLSDEAMDRAIEALRICSVKLRNRQLRNQRLIATEACRQAENGEVFLDRVREETGLELEIVTRETEAHLAAEGCGALMDRKSKGAVLFDIGGGSSELVLVDDEASNGRRISDKIVGWTSLPMGVVTLAEQFGGKEVSHQLFDDMVDRVSEEIARFDDRGMIDHVFESNNAHLLGTSGTVTTIAGLHLELPRYDRRKVDGLWLNDHEVDAIIEQLLKMGYEERAANPCIGAERADLVLAGCAILNAIRREWPAKRLRVADRGLREGLLTEMINKDRSWQRPKGGRWSRKRRKKRTSQRMAGEN